MSTAKRVIKNTGFLYAKVGITMFISLYTTRLILNSLGANDFGIFSIVGGTIAMLGFLNASMAGATQRFMSYSEGEGDKEKKKRIFNISTILHFFIAIILGFVLLACGHFFFNGILNIQPDRVNAAKVIYGSLILSTMFTVMTVPYDAVLNSRENMLYYAIVGIIESLLKLAVAVAVVYTSGDKLITYGVLMAIIPLINMLFMRVYCHRKYEECVIAPLKYWDKGLMKDMSGFAGWNFLTSATTMITMQGSAILMNVFFGVIANAAHAIANQLAGQVMVFSNNLLKALNPNIVKSEGANKRESMIRFTIIGSKMSFVLLALFAIPLCIKMPFFLSIWLKNPPEYAILFCRLVLIRLMITQFHVPLATAIGAGGKIRLQSTLISIIAIAVLPVTALLYFIKWPVETIYFVFIAMTVLYLFVNTYFMKIKYGLELSYFFSRVVLSCLLISVATLSLGFFLSSFLDNDLLGFFSVSLVCMTFLSMLFYLFVLDEKEKHTLLNTLKKIINK